ncbi:hypothetical protein INT43_002982 [Umbelopsis isabellina]|uniref:Stc1 domain-containing protein n=1 Tax=Mortierella isabellina TaxID=91625 RepID=A0A8H7PQ31_MORIS|nr:hypothetical protein INT43_002982 [Umbelopsis isabellina]
MNSRNQSDATHGAAHANQQSRGPPTYDCMFCKRNLPAEAFSKTQLSKATYNPWAPPGYNKKKQHICCKQCSPGQSSTLTCMVCTKTKPLKGFAKAQRRNAEKARCLICMQKYHDEDIYDSEEDSDDYGDGETW